MKVYPPVWKPAPFPEPPPRWPGSAFSLCHHPNVPPLPCSACPTCRAASEAWLERSEAWTELQAILLVLAWFFDTPVSRDPGHPAGFSAKSARSRLN